MSLAEQLEQAKRRQEIADLDAGDQRAAAEFATRISLPPMELSADIRTLLDPFNKWASERHARRCPAKPVTVGLFALHLADMGVEIEQILAQMNAIEQMHDRWSLPSPIRSVPVRYARKRNDSVKPGMGIDGSKGENFTREHNSDPWNPPKTGDSIRAGGGRYTNNESGLRGKLSDTPRTDPWGTAKVKDIYNDVCKNSLDDDEGGSRPGPIKYGVD